MILSFFMGPIVNLLLILQSSIGSLPDGNYSVKHEFGWKNYYLTISKGNYTLFSSDGSVTHGSVLRNSESYFVADCWRDAYLKNLNSDTSGLGYLMAKSFGYPIMELGNRRKDTIFLCMAYSGNLHVATGKGYLLPTRQ